MNSEGIFQRLNWELSTYKSINLMYQGSSRFSAILKRASCEIDTEYFLVGVTIKVYPTTHREWRGALIVFNSKFETNDRYASISSNHNKCKCMG
jgi:hypothetical protein